MNVVAQIPLETLEKMNTLMENLTSKINFIENRIKEIEEGEQPMTKRSEVMEYLGITKTTYYDWLKDEHDPIPHGARGGKKFFYKSELREWVKGKKSS